MPEKETIQRARRDKAEGKKPTTQAGEFVREEMHHLHEGKHGEESPKQAIAIGLAKARRAGVDLPPPKSGQAKPKTRQSAKSASAKGQEEGPLSGGRKSPARKSATKRAGTTARKSATTARKGGASSAKSKTASKKTAGSRTKTASRGTPARKTAARKTRSRS